MKYSQKIARALLKINAVGFALKKPSIFVRKQKKDHGTKKGVEGGEVKNKTILLLEDHVSTGLSSLKGVDTLRNAGGKVHDCLAITSYEFAEAQKNFSQKNIELHTLTTFEDILSVAQAQKILTREQLGTIKLWFADPQAWTQSHE